MSRKINVNPWASLIGATIVSIEPQNFDDGRGGTVCDPVFHLGNGDRARFEVRETESGPYGIRLVYIEKRHSRSWDRYYKEKDGARNTALPKEVSE